MQIFNRDHSAKFKINNDEPQEIKYDYGHYQGWKQRIERMKMVYNGITYQNENNWIKNHGHSQVFKKVKIYPFTDAEEITHNGN